jgi:two-component sensor histidine kinase
LRAQSVIEEPGDVLERRVAADENAPGLARAMARGFAPDLDDGSAANLYLAVSELVTNAVVHGPGGDVTVRLLRRDRSIRVEVCDEGTEGFRWPAWRDDPRRPHGLELVQVFTDRCGVEHGSETLAWCELDVASDGLG